MNEHPIKALFLDLDGTLLNDQKEITPKNRAAIVQALKAGHQVVITTGRPLSSAIAQAEKLELTTPGCFVISYNGGVVYDMGQREVIFQQTMSLELMRKVMEEAARRGIHVQTYDEKDVLVLPENDDEEIRRYCGLIHTTFRVISSLDEVTKEPPKVLIINYRDPKPLAAFQNWIRTWADGVLDCFFSCDNYVEIVPMGVNKGNALLRMAEQLGIPHENTICAGDSANDLAMLKAAHLGCAMANATEEVKAVSNYITTLDNNHDGIAEIIEKFVL